MVYLEMANTLSQKDADILAALAKGYIKTKPEQGRYRTCFKKAKALKNRRHRNSHWSWWTFIKRRTRTKKALDEMKQLVEMKKGQ